MPNSIDISTPDGSFTAYVSRPAHTRAPAIIILQEIFGVNEGIKSIAESMAGHGFVAICPDLFWRSERKLSMSEASEADQQRGYALYRDYQVERGVSDILATISAARALPYCSGDVGVIGYCLGGLLAFLTAATGRADAVAAYYGGGTERFLDRAGRIGTPLLMHLAEDDEYIGSAAQYAIHTELADNPAVTLHTYTGQQHAFARPGGVHFQRDAAELANQRTLDFMQLHLG